MVETTGGQSREGQGSVLVTPSGTVVGSASARGSSGGRRGTSRSSARKSAEARANAQAQARANEIAQAEARVEAERIRVAEVQSRARSQRVEDVRAKLSSTEKLQSDARQSFAPVRNITTKGLDPERFRIKLSDKERGMPTSKVIRQRSREVATGVIKLGVNVAESTVNFATQQSVQKITFDDAGNRIKPNEFKIGGKLGAIRDRPATTGTVLGQSLGIAPLIAGVGVMSVQSVGKVGVVQSVKAGVSSFAPTKIRTGTFGPLSKGISDTQFGVVSVTSSKGGIRTTNVVGGSADNQVGLISNQVSRTVGGKTVTASKTKVIAPELVIGRTGKFQTNIRVLQSEGITAEAQSISKVSIKSPSSFLDNVNFGDDLQGGIAKAISRPSRDITFSNGGVKVVKFNERFTNVPRIGSISKNVPQGKTFLSGRATPKSFSVEKGLIGGIARKDLRIKGVEINLGKSSSSSSTLGGSGSASVKKVDAGARVVADLQAIKSVPTVIRGAIAKNPSIITTSLPKTISTPQIRPKLAQNLQSNPQLTTQQRTTTQNIQTTKAIQVPRQRTGSGSRTKQRTGQLPVQRSGLSSAQRPIQISISKTLQRSKQDTKQRTLLKSQSIFRSSQSNFNVPIRIKTAKTKTTTPLGFKLPKLKKKGKKQTGDFTVQVRRGGVFKTIGKTTDLNRAVSIGTSRVSTTLGATFRIQGTKNIKGVGTPTGFRLPRASSKIKGPLTFIEKSKFRLSKVGEVKEIQQSKKRRLTK